MLLATILSNARKKKQIKKANANNGEFNPDNLLRSPNSSKLFLWREFCILTLCNLRQEFQIKTMHY